MSQDKKAYSTIKNTWKAPLEVSAKTTVYIQYTVYYQ